MTIPSKVNMLTVHDVAHTTLNMKSPKKDLAHVLPCGDSGGIPRQRRQGLPWPSFVVLP